MKDGCVHRDQRTYLRHVGRGNRQHAPAGKWSRRGKDRPSKEGPGKGLGAGEGVGRAYSDSGGLRRGLGQVLYVKRSFGLGYFRVVAREVRAPWSAHLSANSLPGIPA